jgi:hypothetical protein
MVRSADQDIQEGIEATAIVVDPPEGAVCFECGFFIVEGFGDALCSWKNRKIKADSPACGCCDMMHYPDHAECANCGWTRGKKGLELFTKSP